MSISAADILSKELPPIGERRTIHVINPISGSARYFEAAKRAVENIHGKMIVSEHPGHITELFAEIFTKDPYAHGVIYGGDGSVNEAANGIMQAGAGQTGVFSVVPSGSGNDFSAYANDSGAFEKSAVRKIDLIRTKSGNTERYCVNMMNIGFDCDVVRETYTIKQGIFKGSMAYIAGLLKVLAVKKAVDAEITLTGVEAFGEQPATESLTVKTNLLLTSCANSQFCGGGFHTSPYASLTDGFGDILIINDLPRLKFLSLVGDYRAGTFVDEKGYLRDRFKGILSAYRCRGMKIRGPQYYCLDGEVLEADGEIEAEMVPEAIGFAAL